MRGGVLAVLLWCQMMWLHALAQTTAPQGALAQMPVKELVVFKDGHAYVIHEGDMPTDERGNVVLDYLPAPILGTFWAYCASPQAKLQAVVAGQRRVSLKHTALSIREILEANVGAKVVLTEISGTRYTGVIVDVPACSPEELEAISPPNTGDKLPLKGNILLLKTDEGTRAMNLDRVLDVTFLGDYATATTDAEFRNLLTLHLNWGNRQPQKRAQVGMMYVQKGVRWIPQYRLVLDGKGNAKMFLQASVINELTDFRNATVDLVIGVPSFAYKDTRDPIGLQQTFAQLSQYFRTDAGRTLSNALMAQAPRAVGGALYEEEGTPPPPAPDLGPEVAGAGVSEDLFVFTVKNVSLRKGERMTLPVSEYTLKYKDVYTLYVPPFGSTPPAPSPSEPRAAEVQSALAAPKVIHRVRLTNTTEHPFTTAPILLFSGDTVLAQDTITYTPRGGTTDIAIGTAVNIPVKQIDKELKRTAKATTISGVDYTLVEMEGTLTITNYSEKAVDLEVTRQVVGELDSTTPEAEVSKRTVAGRPVIIDGSGYPTSALNPLSQIVWKISLAPGKSVELKCRWQYYTR